MFSRRKALSGISTTRQLVDPDLVYELSISMAAPYLELIREFTRLRSQLLFIVPLNSS